MTEYLNRTWSNVYEESKIRIMFWNCLANELAKKPYNGEIPFPHTDQSILEWNYRYPLIIKEITIINPDILCLAEIDGNDYINSFQKDLLKLGYNSIHKNKLQNNDGVCIAWKINKFNLEKSTIKSLHQQHSQIAIFIMLKIIEDGKRLCLVNTHLKSKSDFLEVRNEEGNKILEILEEFNDTNAPQVICGDFNESIDRGVCQLLINNNYQSIQPEPNEGEDYWTTWKKRDIEIKKQEDYIWIKTDSRINPVAIYKLPEYLEVPNLLPCYNHPSDHLLMACDITLV